MLAETNVATLLAHFRGGSELVIESDARPVAVLRAAEPLPGRLLCNQVPKSGLLVIQKDERNSAISVRLWRFHFEE